MPAVGRFGLVARPGRGQGLSRAQKRDSCGRQLPAPSPGQTSGVRVVQERWFVHFPLDAPEIALTVTQVDVLAFYEHPRTQLAGWTHLAALRAFLPELFAARDLSGCYFFTSHSVLCVSLFATYQARHGQPLLSIYATTAEHLEFQFSTFVERPPIFRALTERVVCPLASGLAEFDPLFQKFLAAHHTPLTPERV